MWQNIYEDSKEKRNFCHVMLKDNHHARKWPDDLNNHGQNIKYANTLLLNTTSESKTVAKCTNMSTKQTCPDVPISSSVALITCPSAEAASWTFSLPSSVLNTWITWNTSDIKHYTHLTAIVQGSLVSQHQNISIQTFTGAKYDKVW